MSRTTYLLRELRYWLASQDWQLIVTAAAYTIGGLVVARLLCHLMAAIIKAGL